MITIMETEKTTIEVLSRKNLVNYLDRVSLHLFSNGKTIFTVLKKEDSYYNISCNVDLENFKFNKVNIDLQIKYNMKMAKDVVKSNFFVNNKYV